MHFKVIIMYINTPTNNIVTLKLDFMFKQSKIAKVWNPNLHYDIVASKLRQLK